ncbi:MAG: Ig-like domain-containing protein [Nitrospirota bacterium]
MVPLVTLTAPPDTVVNTLTTTITGTVDDSTATVRQDFFGELIPVTDGAFTITLPLDNEGDNFFTISARDPAGNVGIVDLDVIRDTTPPEVTIATPGEGSAVSTPSVTVAGTITDLHPGSATVAVNGGAPVALPQDSGSYSTSVTLEDGPNTIRVDAIDAAGNVGSLTRSVILDVTPPVVQLTAPAAGTSLTGVITITAEASDALSGLARVESLVDGVLQATRFAPPFTFEVDTIQVPAGSHALTARAVDGAGNAAEASISVEIQPQIQIAVTAPADGSTVLYSPILVQGTIVDNYGPGEIGITVNGYVAETQSGKFSVDGVALPAGANALTATATDGAGVTAAAVGNVTVVSDQSSPPVTLTAEFPSNLAPVAVTFTADTAVPNPITLYRVDFEGDGAVDSVSSTWNGLTHTYAAPGLYIPSLTVIDSSGQIYSAATVVNVLDGTAMNGLLQAKWQTMRQALAAGDVEHAVAFLVGPNQDRYRRQFLALTPYLSQIAADMGAISDLLALDPYHAEFALRRTEPQGEFSYGLIFSRDEQGIWRIQWF